MTDENEALHITSVQDQVDSEKNTTEVDVPFGESNDGCDFAVIFSVNNGTQGLASAMQMFSVSISIWKQGISVWRWKVIRSYVFWCGEKLNYDMHTNMFSQFRDITVTYVHQVMMGKRTLTSSSTQIKTRTSQ